MKTTNSEPCLLIFSALIGGHEHTKPRTLSPFSLFLLATVAVIMNYKPHSTWFRASL